MSLLFFIVLFGNNISATELSGQIVDAQNGDPVPFATINVIGSNLSTSANKTGHYRLSLDPGQYQIKATHIAHYSQTEPISIASDKYILNFSLEPATIELPPIRVYDKQYDAAQRIILEAIKRKETILKSIAQYDFNAYTKLIVSKEEKAKIEIAFITETQVEGYYTYPDNYKQIITARKQSANIKSEENMVSVGEILDFNRNRIDFGRDQVVSPTAKDALDYYNYYLMDTIEFDGKQVFVLEIEPKSETTPLFEGTINIADSSFAVVGVEVGFNEGFSSNYISSPKYRQIFSHINDDIWMPTFINFTLALDLKIPAFPTLYIDYSASIYNYSFDRKSDDDIFDEYIIEVSPTADEIDSTAWYSTQLIPLTEKEIYGYHRIDSMETNKPFYKKMPTYILGALAVPFLAYDFYHFNRVDGHYLGLKIPFKNDRFDLFLKAGYAIDAEEWQYHTGGRYSFDKKNKLKIGFDIFDQTRTRQTVISNPNGNATFLALLAKTDAYDYFRQTGFNASAIAKPFRFGEVSLTYDQSKYHSRMIETDYSLFNKDDTLRDNPAIFDGPMHSFRAEFTYDNRRALKNKNRIEKLGAIPYTILKIGAEYAPDKFSDNVFDFQRYYLSLDRVQRLFNWGVTSFSLFSGIGSKKLPPQKYFVIDFGADPFEDESTFHTLSDINFSGSEALAMYAEHDFGRRLFKASKIPLIKDIPLGLNIHGGAFWTDFNDHNYFYGDEALPSARTAYSEFGFGINQLPMFMRFDFTWQLSDYGTDKFAISMDFDF